MQGLVLLALSAGISPLRPASCEGISCPQATGKQFSVFFAALYLTSIGTGGVKSALLPFAAEQYDVDGGPEQAPRKQSFFTWFFGAINLGIFVAGTLVSWLQQNVSWALGFGVSALCLLLAAIGFLPGTPWYRIQRPVGHSRAYSSIAPPPTVAVARCSHSPVEMRPRTTTWVTGGGTRLPGIVNDKGGA
jgi:peptide/histidine transporter 3/4